MRILLLFLTFTFAGELDVEGDLKVSGNIDAQNNPIKNVGMPQELTDAINGNVLQDALRDDGPFEYKIYMVSGDASAYTHLYWYEYIEDTNAESDLPNPYFHNELFQLLNNGWRIDQSIEFTYSGGYGGTSGGIGSPKQLIIFKRPLEE